MSDETRKAELLALVRSVPSPTRAQRQIRSLIAAAAALAIMVALFVALGGVRPGGHLTTQMMVVRPLELMVITFAGAAVLAATALWALFWRGKSMLGRKRAWLIIFSVLIVGLLFGWKVFASSSFPDMTVPWERRPGYRCLGISLLFGAWPFAALCFIRHRSDSVHPRLTGAALGVVAGACTWLLVDLWCPVAYPPHLLFGHVLPVVLFALLGMWLGGRWIALR